MTTQPEPAAGNGESSGTGFTAWEYEPTEVDEPADGGFDRDESLGEPTYGPEPKLTVAAVARRLGVAPATLRTWDRRYGLGPSDHTSGHHRRYGSRDVARLELMQRALLRGASPSEAARFALSSPLPTERPEVGGAVAVGPPEPTTAEEAPDPSASATGGEPLMVSGVLGVQEIGSVPQDSGGLSLPDAGAQARGLGRAALALDSWSAQHLILESIGERGVVETWQQVLRPVLQAVAERRQSSDSGVEVLHLLVECASTALRATLAHAPQPVNPRPVLLGCVPGETRTLQLTVLAAALASHRVGQRLFGAALPHEGLTAAVRRAAPAAVVLWAHESTHASPELLTDLPSTRQRVRLFAGGPGWPGTDLPAQVEHLPSLEVATERIEQVVLDAR